MKTLQSIKKGISLLDERRAELPPDEADGTGAPADGEGWLASAEEFDDDAEEDASLQVRR